MPFDQFALGGAELSARRADRFYGRRFAAEVVLLTQRSIIAVCSLAPACWRNSLMTETRHRLAARLNVTMATDLTREGTQLKENLAWLTRAFGVV